MLPAIADRRARHGLAHHGRKCYERGRPTSRPCTRPSIVENIADAAKVLRSDVAREMLDTLPSATGSVRRLLCHDRHAPADDRAIPSTMCRSLRHAFSASPFPAPPIRRLLRDARRRRRRRWPLTQVYDSLANAQNRRDRHGFRIDHQFSLLRARAQHGCDQTTTMFGMVALISGRVWGAPVAEDQAILREAVQTALRPHHRPFRGRGGRQARPPARGRGAEHSPEDVGPEILWRYRRTLGCRMGRAYALCRASA